MNSPHPPAADTPSPDPATTPTRPASTKRRRKATGALVIAAGLLGAGAIATAVVPEPQVATAQQDQAALIAEGKSIYDVACITCHGQNLQGVEDRGPSLVGVGAGSTYFQVHSGRMPAADNEAQAERKKPRYSEHQIIALAAYVDVHGGGPGIVTDPDGKIAQGSLRGASGQARAEEIARGSELFRLNCASCHNFTGRGGALSAGKYAPILDPANEQEIYQAMLTGPQNMPKFSDRQLTPDEKKDIIAFIKDADSKVSPGGYGLGGLGPVTEGVAMWLVGIVALIGATLWIGSRS
ncbi:c-type cytochrome [Dietzia kunjamensis]|uniref:cytochrome bc1 complex diheme cytochrome c subunit n=1 Tax=Dietzia kunjamensis TaxID=322509 RepID=UPI002097BE56|nr:cytochrome c [Dietzia kunjamensis]USX47012.1 cytochrome c [Dietzia kunjamensis]